MTKIPYIIVMMTILAFGIYPSSGPERPLHQSSGQFTSNEVSSLPSEVNIPMTFYAQAPFGNWSLPWQEACEEASALLIANAYYQHNWTRDQFNEEILKLVDWEKEHFGKYIDTSASETAEILNQYLSLQTKIHENPTEDQVKKILANGHLIIGFFAGRQLGNPNYQNGGPRYHVLVIKGYRQNDQFITADVGTSRGADYIYSWSTLQKALHDLADPIESGPKLIVEVWPVN